MRYPPIPEAEWTPEQHSVARAILDGPRGELRGPFVPLLHAPLLAAKVQELGEVIRFKTNIADGPLEVAVLLTARHHDCPNIWESHARLALRAGVARDTIVAISARQRPPGMTADEALAYDYAAGLLVQHKADDALFSSVVTRWGKKGAMELAAISGYYGLLATVLNAAERPLLDPSREPFAAP